MFWTNTKWILKENNRIYPLTLVFSNKEPVEYINDSTKITVCSTCKESRLHRLSLNIIKTPLEIERILINY